MSKYSRSLFLGAILLFAFLSACTTPQAPEANTRQEVSKVVVLGDTSNDYLNDLATLAKEYMLGFPIQDDRFPRTIFSNGKVRTVPSRDWTSGFYPGQLWLWYELTGDPDFRTAAESWTSFLEEEKNDNKTHDIGFKIYGSFGQGYRLTGDATYRQVILDAANALITRYNDTIGCIRSWDFNQEEWAFPVIIDNMMNLELLFAATRMSGDSTYYNIAYRHALTTLDNHVREDCTNYHLVDFDPQTGAVRGKQTHQGAFDESNWARGLAWNIHGFAIAYRETRDVRFLRQALGAASFFYQHPNLREDGIPYWDFDAPGIPDSPRDASAAAICASGILLLCQIHSGLTATYLPFVDKSLESLKSMEYMAEQAPFLLQHSTGHKPQESEVDVPIIYADYYFVEALKRRMQLEE